MRQHYTAFGVQQILRRAFSAVLALALTVVSVSLSRAADQTEKVASETSSSALAAAEALYDGVRQETLPNGLRVYLKPVPSSPVVTTMIAYRVGSADEDLDNTGLSHYLEHLMFKGTDKLMPGDIDHRTLINGGANNAYTSNDYTIFHFDLAADRWEMGLEIEADRMRNLKIDTKHEFEQEKGAVIAELSRDEDQPWDLEQKAILPLLFGPEAPYGHPVIGQKKQVAEATAAIIKSHYDKWYHPNNAVLVICGGFDPDQALKKITELFGSIPSEKLPPRKKNVAIERTKPMHHEFVSKFEVPRMLLGFSTVTSSDDDLPALEVAQSVLSSGKRSRFYQKLIEGEQIAGQADAFHSWGRYPGWFGVQVEVLPGKDRARAERLVLDEIKRLADEPIPQAELDRVRQGIIAGAIFDRESVHQLADNISQGVTDNDLAWLKSLLPRMAAVTPADIQRVAKKYLDPERRVVVWSIPKSAKERAAEEAAGDAKSAQAGAPDNSNEHAAVKRPADDKKTPEAKVAENVKESGAGDRGLTPPARQEFSLKPAKRVKLPNGLVLVLWENHRLPIFVAAASVKQVSLREPIEKAGVAALMGSLLDEGTAHRTGEEISEAIEKVGGSLALNSSGGTVKVLSEDKSLGLRLLMDCLINANFPNDAFKREQEHQLANIDEAQRQPLERAMIRYRKAVYGSHPFAKPSLGTRPIVEKLSPDDCAALHKQLFVPNNTIVVIAGDFNSDEIVAQLTKLTEHWTKSPLPEFKSPTIEKPKTFTTEILSMPEAVQLQFLMGHVGIRRDNPDYYKLLVMDYVLGTGPGFTDRLSSKLRDRAGLAYTVTANICSSAAEEPGIFTCYVGTEAKNFPRVKQMFLEELNRIRSESPTAAEVEDVKKYLIGQLPFEFTTDEQIAGRLLSVERHHLGFDYLADFRREISAVTPDDVQQVAKKYLDPDRMVLVVAGAVDEKGEPIPEK